METWKDLALLAAGCTSAMLAVMVKWFSGRVSAHDAAITKLQIESATKDDLEASETRLHVAMQQGFNHISERIGDLRDDVKAKG